MTRIKKGKFPELTVAGLIIDKSGQSRCIFIAEQPDSRINAL